MTETFSAGDYEDSVDEALAELRANAGIGNGDTAPAPVATARANMTSDINPELRLLKTLFYKRVATFAEVMAPDRIATINQIRREGRI